MGPKKLDIAAMVAAARKTKEVHIETTTPLALLKAKLTANKIKPDSIVLPPNTVLIDDPIINDIVELKPEEPVITDSDIATGMHGESIIYNSEQSEFVNMGGSGQSCVLVGAAGTGKTTATQGFIKKLLDSGNIPILKTDGHKHLIPGTPGIIIISYTRRAVNNIRKVQSAEMQHNCVTAHKLLEYRPEYFEIYDEETKKWKNTMRFEPSRNAMNPLPDSITCIVVEEGSMLGTDLYQQIDVEALQHPIQWVFIGDIQQLPPVFGPAILGFKLNELPVIELTHVYRQALKSPIICLAHRILSGKPIPASEYEDWKIPGQITIRPWKKKTKEDDAMRTLGLYDADKNIKGVFPTFIDNGAYNPEEDMILMPFNKSVGTIELNKHIANYLARRSGAITFEVIAGYIKHYYSIGDKILYDREDAEIIDIYANPAYSGARPQHSSSNLDYWGHNPKLGEESGRWDSFDPDADIDFLLEQAYSSEDRVTQCSHTIVVRLLDSDSTLKLSKAAEVNGLLHSYALTVHKAQGSEWNKVFVIFHWSHATMLSRELLYTAVTRAKKELYIICEPESFTKGIISQRIKGETLAEKAEYFKGKQI